LTKYQSGNQHFNVIIDRFLYSDNGDFSIKNLHERYKVYNTLRNNGETLKKESYIRLKKAVDSA